LRAVAVAAVAATAAAVLLLLLSSSSAGLAAAAAAPVAVDGDDGNNDRDDGDRDDDGATKNPVVAAADPKELFLRTVQAWHRSSSPTPSWKPWEEYSSELVRLFADDEQAGVDVDDDTTGTEEGRKDTRRLDLVAAAEEGILAVERTVFEQTTTTTSSSSSSGEGGGSGGALLRDRALSKMYAGYGRMLSLLTPEECVALATDPHTLLIGAESVRNDAVSGKSPSNFVCAENADNALRNAITLDATNAEAEELLEGVLAASTQQGGDGDGDGAAGMAVHKRKPKEFVAELFDSFADTFDRKLLENLEYRVPELIGEALLRLQNTNTGENSDVNAADDGGNRAASNNIRTALDAGCGTGLAGRYVRPFVEQALVGVDASSKMLDIAARCTYGSGCGLVEDGGGGDRSTKDERSSRPLYEKLLVMDLEEMTVENTLGKVERKQPTEYGGGFDLIVAADVLVYFGSLERILDVFASLSTPGSILIFTCERADPSEAPLGWRLLPSGRFSHTKDHAASAASKAGYRLELYDEIIPRAEKGEPVRGHLFGFVLANDSSNKETSRSQKEEL